jgi:hypothetical protein
MSAHELIDILDEHKEAIPEGLYLQMSNLLMKRRRQETSTGLPEWVKPGAHCIMNPHLQRFLCIPEMDCTRHLTLKIESIHETLPQDANLGQYVDHDDICNQSDREDTGGCYIKCIPNMNVAIASLDDNHPYPDNDDEWIIKPMWIEPWMIAMTMHVGEVGCLFPYVIRYPRALGWTKETFKPYFHDNVSLFERYESEDPYNNDFISIAHSDLDEDHPMKWVGEWRGMRYGKHWKLIRQYLTAKFFLKVWQSK